MFRRKPPLLLLKNTLILVFLILLILNLGLFFWMKTWVRFDDARGVSMRHPVAISSFTNTLVLGKGSDTREDIATFSYGQENQLIAPFFALVFRYPHSVASGKGLEHFSEDQHEYQKSLSQFFTWSRTYNTLIGGKRVIVVEASEKSPDGDYSYRTNHYFIEGEKYYYEISAVIYEEDFQWWLQKLNDLFFSLLFHTFRAE